jgi:hypothetical protein
VSRTTGGAEDDEGNEAVGALVAPDVELKAEKDSAF